MITKCYGHLTSLVYLVVFDVFADSSILLVLVAMSVKIKYKNICNKVEKTHHKVEHSSKKIIVSLKFIIQKLLSKYAVNPKNIINFNHLHNKSHANIKLQHKKHQYQLSVLTNLNNLYLVDNI